MPKQIKEQGAPDQKIDKGPITDSSFKNFENLKPVSSSSKTSAGNLPLQSYVNETEFSSFEPHNYQADDEEIIQDLEVKKKLDFDTKPKNKYDKFSTKQLSIKRERDESTESSDNSLACGSNSNSSADASKVPCSNNSSCSDSDSDSSVEEKNLILYIHKDMNYTEDLHKIKEGKVHKYSILKGRA